DDFQGKADEELSDKPITNSFVEGESDKEGERCVHILSPVCDQDEVHSTQSVSPQGGSGACEIRISDTSHASKLRSTQLYGKPLGNLGEVKEIRLVVAVLIL
ncbi:hypothetical protein A2U01_0071117, partial [Trifolium medium]|nr:hypothetical protein [Trifolium medium]